MEDMKIVYKDIDDLTPYENNPRNNDEAVEYVANSIAEFGFKVPLVIDKDNVVVSGHTRLRAAKKLGIRQVPCILADDLDEQQIKAFRLADNRVGEIATWDMDKLAMEIGEMDFDMGAFGFDSEFYEIEDFSASADDLFYTRATNIPQYEIKGDEPELSELVDTSKADFLIAEIDEADIPDDIKAFLRMAATRHYVFTYSKIAEYYAHASEEVQELMERSALVIIDYNDAIANGYVSLTADIASMRGEDYA